MRHAGEEERRGQANKIDRVKIIEKSLPDRARCADNAEIVRGEVDDFRARVQLSYVRHEDRRQSRFNKYRVGVSNPTLQDAWLQETVEPKHGGFCEPQSRTIQAERMPEPPLQIALHAVGKFDAVGDGGEVGSCVATMLGQATEAGGEEPRAASASKFPRNEMHARLTA
ncbi:hypothetical protein ANI02nite_05190 [Acetobacter nitrogenifigens DSM 23921 = NBRC 105050]|uniref:Uncharacterized protein n=1 Tax=Acetobacter nitrogenifigens DSM 23921 = NBRC 105050 TaxID=1120919 RepID=A0A511X6U3_9PROT|nr:hypothetical protein ANI02nite_05190 [Acetobacter nitrogenifigens DSM 23921 = NBRC 105050]